jgi:LmbE family N-acetylglucosaminyl deacetylase
MKILVIAAHPDDETLGCGGTILKHTKKGNDVFLCIATRPEAKDYGADVVKEKRKEALAVAKALGVKESIFCEWPTKMLDTYPQVEINDKLGEVVNKVKPEIVYIPHAGDVHQDHRVLFEASLVACRPKPNGSVKKIFSYECLSETEWGSPIKPFVPNVYEDIHPFLEKKIGVFKLYKTEIQKWPHPRSAEGVKIAAQRRGMEVGLEAAEAFMLVREVR